MFSSPSRVVLAAVLLLGSCARRQPAEIQRLAVLRFENLSADPSSDWMGRALADVIAAELAGSSSLYAMPSSRLHALDPTMGSRPIAAPGVSAEASLAQAAGATRIGYGEYTVAGGRLRARLTIQDAKTGSVARGPLEAAAAAADPIAAATALAKQISSDAQPYSTGSAAAVEAYARGLEAPDAGAVRRYCEQAIAADTDFGPAHVLLVETALRQHDRSGAMAALQAAMDRGTRLPQPARLRLDVVAAGLRGDAAARDRALGALTQSAPLDPVVWRAFAEESAGRRDYRRAIAAYTRALSVEPEDAASWNQLGYISAAAGSLDSALSALRRYQALRPGDANPLDSMGDVNLMYGRLKEAEALYLEAHKKNPAFLNGLDLYKAAVARLMTGDVAGASAILGDKAGVPDWLWLAGRRRDAYAKLAAEAENTPVPERRARAFAQLAIWAVLLDDRDAAARAAEQAQALATPSTAALAALARFVSQPRASAADWNARAERAFANPALLALKEFALANALLLDRRFADALPLLRRIEPRSGSGGDRSAAILLAWALIETGNVQEAAPLLRFNPVPGTDSAANFVGLYFPRLYQLRALIAERDGKADEARENRRIYAALGGL